LSTNKFHIHKIKTKNSYLKIRNNTMLIKTNKK
jgi:hypothetical protein